MKNLFYFYNINIIGGIEQFFAYLAEKYKDWDITIVYKNGDPKQLARLRRYVKVEKFTGQKFICDNAYFCFNTEIRDYIQAKTYSLILHGDYQALLDIGTLEKNCYIFTEEFDNYYGVSQIVCDSFSNITGKKCQLVYNPFIKEPTKRLLKLVYCGRLTSEKGGDIVVKLAEELDNQNVPYKIFVYSDKDTLKHDNIIYMGTRLDAGQFLNPGNFDYVIVPSKCEGYCYTLIQAFANGLPAVITPCPVFKELGANEKNSITIDFDGKNVEEVVKKMKTSELKFTYTPKEDNWDKILEPGETNYHYNPVLIKALHRYYDGELERNIDNAEVYETSEERAKLIVDNCFAEYYKEEI